MPRLKLLTAIAAIAAVALTAVVAPSAGAAQSRSKIREVEGTVLSVDRKSRTFRLRDRERGTFRIHVTGRTRYERLRGLSSLRRGMRGIEAEIRRSNGRWVAIEVERSRRDDDDRDDDRDDD